MKSLPKLGFVLMIISTLLFISNRIHQGLVIIAFSIIGLSGNVELSFFTTLLYVVSIAFFLIGLLFVCISIKKEK